MKYFNKISAVIIVLIASVIFIANMLFTHCQKVNNADRPWQLDINRICHDIEENGEADVSDYDYIIAVVKKGDADDFYSTEKDYSVREINGELYRIEYRVTQNTGNERRKIMNFAFAFIALIILLAMLYIRIRLIQPFHKFTNVPYKLSKGELTAPLKEEKSRYFGKFVWGVNMLRENIIKQKESEIEMLREKQTMLLSISHDIKTPLSAIKLYAKALSKGLYSEKEKQLEAALSINAKADEIEKYVTELTKTAGDDLLSLDVDNGEFYLSEILNDVIAYYNDRLEMNKTDFIIADYNDCILKGDASRLNEVMQNIMENALKYGDGERISIDFSDDEDCRLITFSNTGCTLPDDELLYIFDSFRRGSNAGDNPGSGLGLYICRQLMRKMDGEVFAEIEDGEMKVTIVARKA